MDIPPEELLDVASLLPALLPEDDLRSEPARNREFAKVASAREKVGMGALPGREIATKFRTLRGVADKRSTTCDKR